MEEGKTKTEREQRDQHLTPDNSVGNKSPNQKHHIAQGDVGTRGNQLTHH